MKSSRDKRISKRNDIIKSYPDKSIHDVASGANSPLSREAETELKALPSLETSELEQIPDAGCLENLYASSFYSQLASYSYWHYRIKIYFEKLHYGAPILRRSAFLSEGLSPSIRPPMYLRYIIAALAASIVENHHDLALTLYHQAKLCIDEEELKV